MSKNPWSFELPDSFFETQKFLKSISSSLDTLNKITQTFSVSQNLSGAYAAVASYQSILSNVYSNNTFETLAKSATVMQSVLANIQMPTVIDIIPTMERILPVIDTSWKIPTIDWDWMAKTLLPKISISGFGLSSVSGNSLVPYPPARIIACTVFIFLPGIIKTSPSK